MKKKRITSFFRVFIFFLFLNFNFIGVNIYSQKLNDFTKEVKKERQKKNEAKKLKKKKKPQLVSNDSCLTSFFSEVFSFAIGIWVDYNSSILYSSYPFSKKPWVVADLQEKEDVFDEREEFIQEKEDLGDVGVVHDVQSISKDKYSQYKPYLFVLNADFSKDISVSKTFSYNLGIDARFWGILNPFVKVRQYQEDEVELLKSDYGFHFPIFQNYFLFADIVVKGSSFQNSLNMNGVGVGIKLDIFGFHPLVFHLQGAKLFLDEIEFYETDIKVGYILNRFEFFIGHNLLMMKNADTQLAGFSFGMNVYF